jgi:hypothetical protein
MDSEVATKLRILAPLLNRLTLDQGARCFYEWLSGGLLWRDEIPDLSGLPAGTFEALRGVLRYRTALILGQPDESCKDVWQAAQQLFPNWPGFVPARRSVDLHAMCLQVKAKARQEMDHLLDGK